jgi:hypothetical protein
MFENKNYVLEPCASSCSFCQDDDVQWEHCGLSLCNNCYDDLEKPDCPHCYYEMEEKQLW